MATKAKADANPAEATGPRTLDINISISADKAPDGQQRKLTLHRTVPDNVAGFIEEFTEPIVLSLIDKSITDLCRARTRPGLEGKDVTDANGATTTEIVTDKELQKIVNEYKPGLVRGRARKTPLDKILGNLDSLSDEELEALKARIG